MLKRTLMMTALTAIVIGNASAMDANELVVNQELTTNFYSDGILNDNSRAIEEVFNQEIQNYNCIQGVLKYKVTKDKITKIFSSSIPGDVKLNYQTKCFDSKLIGISFAVSSFGYDEDYTSVVLKFTTTSGVTLKTFCVYGDAEITKCHSHLPASIFSTQAVSK